jgi:hypothetical protein
MLGGRVDLSAFRAGWVTGAALSVISAMTGLLLVRSARRTASVAVADADRVPVAG